MDSKFEKRKRLERKFYLLEMLHYKVYRMLAGMERDKNLSDMLIALAEKEKKHFTIWKNMLLKDGIEDAELGVWSSAQYFIFVLVRRIFGLAFATGYLERDERKALDEYIELLEDNSFTKSEMSKIKEVIRDERSNENELTEQMSSKFTHSDYTRSIVFGFNDGVVEVLAAVVGFAVLATSNLIVIIGGIIIGLSGTLSMSGGAYLSAKSSDLVEEGFGVKEKHVHTSPKKEALYTGIYYFIGALIPILPFALGLSGIYGIAAAIALVIIGLIIASIVIAVISGSSIKKHAAEMVAISLAASFGTIMLGIILRIYFGISI